MTKPFLTTVVGSMPKPAWLMEQVPLNEKGKQLHGKGADWNFTGDLLITAMDDATRVTLHDQENAGIRCTTRRTLGSMSSVTGNSDDDLT